MSYADRLAEKDEQIADLQSRLKQAESSIQWITSGEARKELLVSERKLKALAYVNGEMRQQLSRQLMCCPECEYQWWHGTYSKLSIDKLEGAVGELVDAVEYHVSNSECAGMDETCPRCRLRESLTNLRKAQEKDTP